MTDVIRTAALAILAIDRPQTARAMDAAAVAAEHLGLTTTSDEDPDEATYNLFVTALDGLVADGLAAAVDLYGSSIYTLTRDGVAAAQG